MKIISSPKQMHTDSLKLLQKGKSIGLVPTMGALHEGHISLIKRSKKENKKTIVSIFINIKQFGPNEDYLQYPRPINDDKKICKKLGVDYIFIPKVEDMYEEEFLTYVSVDRMSDLLCGAYRPGHFKGVATVVAKLFNIVNPTKAYFGQKDFQQLRIIEQMVKDLNFTVKVISCPIVRDSNGLALSSRNKYLSSEEYSQSLKISRSLESSRHLIKKRKEKDPEKIVKKITELLNTIPDSKIEYVQVCNPENLQPVSVVKLPVLIAVAVHIGKTRLIDNILVGAAFRLCRN